MAISPTKFATEVSTWMESFEAMETCGGIWNYLSCAPTLLCPPNTGQQILRFNFKISVNVEHITTTVSECGELADESTLGPEFHAANKVSIRIDILLHPAYQIPCPYINAWDSAGSILGISDLVNILTTSHSIPTEFIMDEHPEFGNPCFTLHPCGIVECMRMLETLPDKICEERKGQYIFRWLSLVGPAIAMSVAASNFTKIGT